MDEVSTEPLVTQCYFNIIIPYYIISRFYRFWDDLIVKNIRPLGVPFENLPYEATRQKLKFKPKMVFSTEFQMEMSLWKIYFDLFILGPYLCIWVV